MVGKYPNTLLCTCRKYYQGSWTCEHDLHNTHVQCFKASGKIVSELRKDLWTYGTY